MITYRNLGVVGRLGNALYELASTIGIARAMGQEPGFPAGWLHRPYFSVPDRFFHEIDVLDADGIEAEDSGRLGHIDPRARAYLQDLGLFADVLADVRGYLLPSRTAAETLRPSPFWKLKRPILGIHVRRGDNVRDPGVPDKHRYYPLPQPRYYAVASGPARERAGSVAVFSDDIEWCRRYVPADYYHEGVARPKEHERDFLTAPVLDWIDWHLLSMCDFHVLSNSTFGISAALMGSGPMGWRDMPPTVPWPIYGPKLAYINAGLLFPSNWRRLDNRTGLPC